MLKLVIEDDEGKQTIVPLIRDEITIGRQDGNTIRLTERNVSRRHARLVKENNQLFFENVSARYGSKFNSESVSGRLPFREGDVFVVGDYRLYLQGTQPAMKPASPPQSPSTQPVIIPASMPTPLPQQASPTPTPSPVTGPVPMPSAPRSSDHTAVIQFTPAPSQAAAPAAAVSDSHKLVALNTNLAGKEFVLGKNDLTIGRTNESDLVVDHRSISRRHARITIANNSVRVTDMGSANGVRVGGEPYTTIELRRGDILELGHVHLRYVSPGEAYVFKPGAEEVKSAKAKGGLGKIIGIAAGAVVVLGLGAYFAFGRSGSEPTGSDQQIGSQDVESSTPSQQQTVTPTEAQPQLNVYDQGEELMQESRWQEAIALFEQVTPGDPHYRDADLRLIAARVELRHQETYQRILDAETQGQYQNALALINEIPPESSYTRLIAENGVAQRIQQAWLAAQIASAQRQVDRGRFDSARQELEVVRASSGTDPQFTEALASIDRAEAQALAQREQIPRQEATQAPRQEATQAPRQEATQAPRQEATQAPRQEATQAPRQEATRAPRQEATQAETGDSTNDRDRVRELVREAGRAGMRGNHQEAIDLLNEAKALDPGNHRIYMMLYRNYTETGDNRNAARALERYLELRPDDPNAEEYRRILDELR